MQTFLPFPSFPHSVAVLDRARLGKQRLECSQMLAALDMLSVGVENVPWGNHPATLMWRGHESALALYQTFAIREWVARGYENNIPVPYDENWCVTGQFAERFTERAEDIQLPPWIGKYMLHSSHRAALLRKYPEHYGPLGWDDTAEDYWWPTKEMK